MTSIFYNNTGEDGGGGDGGRDGRRQDWKDDEVDDEDNNGDEGEEGQQEREDERDDDEGGNDEEGDDDEDDLEGINRVRPVSPLTHFRSPNSGAVPPLSPPKAHTRAAAGERPSPSPLRLSGPAMEADGIKTSRSASNLDQLMEQSIRRKPAKPPGAVHYQKILISNEIDIMPNEESSKVCRLLKKAMDLRKKYVIPVPSPNWGGLDKSLYINPEGTPSLSGSEYTTERVPSPSPSLSSLHGVGRSSELRDASRVSEGKGRFDVVGRRRRRRPDVAFQPFPTDDLASVTPEIDSSMRFEMKDGVMQVWAGAEDAQLEEDLPTKDEYYKDFDFLVWLIAHGPAKSFTFQRLRLLESKFRVHVELNSYAELEEQKSCAHRDFYNVRKVDTHIHHSACMNAKHLLRFIKHKLRTCPDEVVIFRDGQFLTLSEVFHSLRMSAYDLSVDRLDMHAHDTFERFDRFNLKYNPCGQSRLREIFLKTNNLIQGRYLADITREVFADVENSKYQLMEPRISIYGRSRGEWSRLGRWVYDNRLVSKHVRWLVQIPRLYHIYYKIGQVKSFQEIIDNIFQPLFAVTKDPSSDPKLHWFLQQMVAFDCVDDESKVELRMQDFPAPSSWTMPENPPYSYWMYYLWANLRMLNAARRHRGFNTFALRPHCGEAGSVNHLASGFLIAHHINHGIRLVKCAVMQYLFYLEQIGLAMSPLSNNRLFLRYERNPLPKFFKRGLNVSISTDDPLQLHLTKDALVEEYSVAAQVYGLSSCDMCELARNSVLQSGFEHPFKMHFVGKDFMKQGPAGNDITMTNVPDIRLQFRADMLNAEHAIVERYATFSN